MSAFTVVCFTPPSPPRLHIHYHLIGNDSLALRTRGDKKAGIYLQSKA